jgi:hypothetical protein
MAHESRSVQGIWWAAMLLGISYMLPVLADWNGPLISAWKGSCVGMLAVWAGMYARDAVGWMFTAILAIGAVGDVVLDFQGLKAGAVLFVTAHILSCIFYLRHRRAVLTMSQRLFAIALPPGVALTSWAITAPVSPDWPLAVGYATVAALMAAFAWTSRFPRYRTGIGAIAFVLSDLAIFAGEAGLLPPELRRVSVWPLYFGGQALIAWGVVTTLAKERAGS